MFGGVLAASLPPVAAATVAGRARRIGTTQPIARVSRTHSLCPLRFRIDRDRPCEQWDVQLDGVFSDLEDCCYPECIEKQPLPFAKPRNFRKQQLYWPNMRVLTKFVRNVCYCFSWNTLYIGYNRVWLHRPNVNTDIDDTKDDRLW